MGLIIGIAGIAGLVVSLVCMGISIILLRHARRKHGRGSWRLSLLLFVLGAAVVGCLGASQFPGPHAGAPSGDDYESMIRGAFIFCLSPAIGSVLSLLPLMKKREA